jgi:hypothetical protein
VGLDNRRLCSWLGIVNGRPLAANYRCRRQLNFFPLVRKVIDEEIFAEAVAPRCG